MKATFVSRLTYLRINGSLGRGVQFADGFFITNDKGTISSILDVRLLPAIGTLEFNFLKEGPLIYAVIDDVDEDDFIETARIMLSKMTYFEQHFWVLSDGCVGHEVGFIFGNTKNGAKISSLRYEGAYTLPSGDTEELECSADAFRKLVTLLRDASKINSVNFSDQRKTHTSKKEDPLRLAIHLIGFARSSGFIPHKIAFYCSALEAMLSTSQSELSHQIAERVAIVINTDETRIEKYRFVKKCYGIRSKFIHGDTVSVKEDDLVGISKKLDQTVRETVQAIISDDNLREAVRDKSNLLDDLILGRVLSFPLPTQEQKAD